MIEEISSLVENLSKEGNCQEKIALLQQFSKVSKNLQNITIKNHLTTVLKGNSPSLTLCFLSLLAIGQEEILKSNEIDIILLLSPLEKVEEFYKSIGGIVGYHATCLKLLENCHETHLSNNYERPSVFDVREEKTATNEAVFAGINALKEMGEIYLLGGMGERLKLKNEKGDSIPVATLPFCGKTLLEHLVRDVEGREYLYYKLFGEKIHIPIALMTSFEKENDRPIRKLLEEKNWFGRGMESFFLFSQIPVPMITEEGKWVLKNPNEFLMQPGGHGAFWKTAKDKQVFTWLKAKRKTSFLVRQINNPIAGLDFGLLALFGIGVLENKILGFASCERVVNAAEGMLACLENSQGFSIVNIEYTDFSRYGITDLPNEEGYSQYPANTNILYVDRKKMEEVIDKHPIPDFLLNMKTKVLSQEGDQESETVCGRLESLVQNISTHLFSKEKKKLPTFVTFNERGKTISTTKRSFDGKTMLETPEGAFYDLLKAGYDLLASSQFSLPPFSSQASYLKLGPSLLFLYHPSLGPLYEIIRQKLRGGTILQGSELQIDIAEILVENLNLKGSLLIKGENRGERSGKCYLSNVSFKNRGIDRKVETSYWRNEFGRKEAFTLTLHGRGEFVAENIEFIGHWDVHVPDNKRWVAYKEGENVLFKEEEIDTPLSWHYREENRKIILEHSYQNVFR